MSTKDGGPAFPANHFGLADGEHGMSMRDYFAAKAMQAAATNPVDDEGFTFDQRAQWAYMQADAMLAARAKEAGDD